MTLSLSSNFATLLSGNEVL